MTDEKIVRAGAADGDAVVATITEAFMDDPVMSWMFPDEARRRQSLPYVVGFFIEQGIGEGTVFTAGDGAAAALWVHEDAGSAHDGPTAEERALMHQVFGPDVERVEAMATLTGERHPKTEAHQYLVFIGAIPARRGGGLGGLLLRERLAELDAAGMPAYLEASSARNQPLYERHGFRAVGEPIQMPGGPAIQPMWRAPRG